MVCSRVVASTIKSMRYRQLMRAEDDLDLAESFLLEGRFIAE